MAQEAELYVGGGASLMSLAAPFRYGTAAAKAVGLVVLVEVEALAEQMKTALRKVQVEVSDPDPARVVCVEGYYAT